ncbi:MAG: hypothetical protein WD065_20250 [Planctomycetaceae bacterium]
MKELRVQLDKDVEKVQFGTKTLLDWHYYVRHYPWACVGVSTLVGFLVVPRKLEMKSPDVETLEKLARKHQLVVRPYSQAQAEKGLFSTAFSFLMGLVVRTAMTQLGAQIAHTMDRLSERHSGNGSNPAKQYSRRDV